MNKNALNPRLKKIAELVPPNKCTADIGTDHAYIPIVLVTQGTASRAIASDIKKGPLMRADANIRHYGMNDKIETRLGAGLKTLAPHDAEVIIIAGMGGILIADILEQSREVTDSAKLLILQPMTAVPELREYLSGNSYEVSAEYLEAEDEKLYNIIVAKSGGKTEYSKKEIYLGKGLEQTSPLLFGRYKDAVITKINKRIEGLKKSVQNESKAELEELFELLRLLS